MHIISYVNLKPSPAGVIISFKNHISMFNFQFTLMMTEIDIRKPIRCGNQINSISFSTTIPPLSPLQTAWQNSQEKESLKQTDCIKSARTHSEPVIVFRHVTM